MSGLTRVAGRLVYSEIPSQEFVQVTGQVLNDEAGVSAVRACTAQCATYLQNRSSWLPGQLPAYGTAQTYCVQGLLR